MHIGKSVAAGTLRGLEPVSRYGREVNSRTVTQSVESNAHPPALVAVLADPRRIPDWAPAFADVVTRDGLSGWRVTKDGQDFSLRVVTKPDAGTVDYLREIAPGREGGAYIRAVPRPGGGSVVVITLPLLPGAEPAATAATLRDELNALVSLAESL